MPEPAGQRDVDGRLVALARPAGARVERPLVQRDVEDGRVVPEDVLRPVAVVDVPVDDRDPLEAELGLRRARRDRDVVEEAEAHRAVGGRVVAGRPHEREAAGADRLDRAAGGEQRRLVARLRRRRVAVEPGRSVDAADPRDVLGGVAALDLLDGRRLCLRATGRPPRAAPRAAAATRGGARSGAAPPARRG